MQRYPEIMIDLRFSDSVIDLIDGGFDIAIRNAELKDSTLVARRLANDKRVLCASPAYISEHGTPQHPEELNRHQCLILSGLDHWSFRSSAGPMTIKARGRLRTDNGDAMRDATVAGLGISINSTWSVYQHLKSGQLVEVLEHYPLISDTAIWAVYPSSRQVAPKVRAFIDYLVEYYGEPTYWDKY